MKKRLLCMVCALALILSGCGADNSAPKETAKNSEKKEITSEATTAASKEEFQELVIEDNSWVVDEDGKYAYYGIILHNPNASYSVEFPSCITTAKDETGKIIASQEDVSGTLPPNDTLFIGSLLDCKGITPATVEFTVTNLEEDYIPASGDTPTSKELFSVSNTAEISDIFGSTFTGEVTNNGTKDFSKIKVSVVLKSNGKMVYGWSSFVDNVKAGATVPFEIDPYVSTLPEYTDMEFYVQAQEW